MIEVISFDVGNTILKTADKKGLFEILKESSDKDLSVYRMAYKDYFLTKKITFDEFCERTGNEKTKTEDIVELFIKNQRPEEVWEDVKEVLTRLKSMGMRMIVLSNKSFFNPYTMSTYGLDSFFEKEIYSCNAGYAKPDRRIFDYAAETLGCSGQQILHVGDSVRSDYKGALSAGWHAFHIERKRGNEELLDIFKRLEELGSK